MYVRKLESLCDTVVHLDSFVGSDKEKNPAYKEYHGIKIMLSLCRDMLCDLSAYRVAFQTRACPSYEFFFY